MFFSPSPLPTASPLRDSDAGKVWRAAWLAGPAGSQQPGLGLALPPPPLSSPLPSPPSRSPVHLIGGGSRLPGRGFPSPLPQSQRAPDARAVTCPGLFLLAASAVAGLIRGVRAGSGRFVLFSFVFGAPARGGREDRGGRCQTCECLTGARA